MGRVFVAFAIVLALGLGWAVGAGPSRGSETSYLVTIDSHCLNVHLDVAGSHWHSNRLIPTEWFNVPVEGTFLVNGDRGWFEGPDRTVSFTQHEGGFEKLICNIP